MFRQILIFHIEFVFEFAHESHDAVALILNSRWNLNHILVPKRVNLKFCFQQQFNFIMDPEADLTVTSNMRFELNIFCCKFKWILDGALYLDFGAR